MTENIHGAGLMIDGIGIVLRGKSGTGKSLLALDLLDWAAGKGLDAFLVADDRLDITERDGGLLMQAPSAIAGKIELRGRGIIERPHIAVAPVHLIVDLVDKLERLVEEDRLVTELMGVTVARSPVPRRDVIDPIHQRLLVIEAFRDRQSP